MPRKRRSSTKAKPHEPKRWDRVTRFFGDVLRVNKPWPAGHFNVIFIRAHHDTGRGHAVVWVMSEYGPGGMIDSVYEANIDHVVRHATDTELASMMASLMDVVDQGA